MRKTTTATLVVLCALTLGCTVDGSPSEPDNEPSGKAVAPTAVKTTKNMPPKKYMTTRALREALELHTSFRCTGYAEVLEVRGALERATCGDEYVISVYASQTDVKESVDVVANIVNMTGSVSVHAIGENWSVNCGDNEKLCQEIGNGLGGELHIRKPE